MNRKDYRAWYGLGQAYELLSMHRYALYYYQHATAFRLVPAMVLYVRDSDTLQDHMMSVYGKPKASVTRKLEGAFVPLKKEY